MKKLLVWAALAGALIGGSAEARPSTLFADRQGLAVAAQVRQKAVKGERAIVVRERRVAVDASAITGAGAGNGAAAIGLNLFPDAEVTAVKRRFERHASGRSVWVGAVEDDPEGSVILVQTDGLVGGSVYAHGKHYAIRGKDADTQEVVEVDQSAFAPEACDQPPSAADLPQAPTAPLTTLEAQADTGSVIDVLVVYTPAALAQRGSTAAMNLLIDTAVAESNVAYQNSGIATRLNLVHTAQVAYTETHAPTGYSTDLARLRNVDGFMDEVHALRNAYAADIVVLLVDAEGNYPGACGYSYINATESYAFSLVGENCATISYTFAHEIGHLQGARHDWYVDNTDNSPNSYNHGHVDTGIRRRTIMSYNNLCADTPPGTYCERVQYFSRPDAFYPGFADPMGSSIENNALTLNTTAAAVANFRQGVVTLSVRSTYPGQGVEVAVSPPDLDGLGAGTTSFSRSYRSGDTVTLTAPATDPAYNLYPLAGWSGCTSVSEPDKVCTVTMNGSKTVTANYDPGNYQPTLNAISSRTISEDAAQQTVTLGGISAGPGETQTLTVTAHSSNPDLIPDPTVVYTSPNATGSLRFTPVANASGTAEVTVSVQDDGGGFYDTVERTFLVTVNAVNDPPTMAPIANVVLGKNAGPQTVALGEITPGPGEGYQPLTVTASSSNTALIPAPVLNHDEPSGTWTLSFTPAANKWGSATITVRAKDGQPANNTLTRTFKAIVNDPPTLGAIADLALAEDAGKRWVSLSGITAGPGESQTLTVKASSDNTALIPNPSVSYTSPSQTGTLSFTPVANAWGSATVRVTVSDGQAGNNVAERAFAVTVDPANDAPTLNSIANRTVGEDAPELTVALSGISAGPRESDGLVVTAVSANADLIPNPIMVDYTSPNTVGSLRFTPLPDRHGSSMITVTVDDGQAENGTVVRAFLLTVTSVNDPPTLGALPDLTIDEDAGEQTVALDGITAGGGESQKLTVSASSSSTGLIPTPKISYASADTEGTLRFTPVANAHGSAKITVKVSDGVTSVSRAFVVTVNPVNDPPTLSAITGRTVRRNAGEQSVSLSGITAGPRESDRPLIVTATSSNQDLIPDDPPAPGAPDPLRVIYTSPNATGSLRFTPKKDASGEATITVRVDDGQSENNIFERSFLVTVNDPPTLNPIASLTVDEDAGELSVGLSGIGASAGGGEPQTLTVTAASSNQSLIRNQDLTVDYVSPTTTGTLHVAPLPNAYGSATITVTVNDGLAGNNTFKRSFTATVKAVNDPPTLDPIADLAIPEGSGQQTVSFSGVSAGPGEKQTLTVTATSSNTAVIPKPTVSYTSAHATGSLRFTPVANALGESTITVTVKDGQTTNNSFSRTFLVTVTSMTEGGPTAQAMDQAADAATVVQTAATADGLQAALAVAEANGARDVIRLAGGVYTLSDNANRHFTYASAEEGDLVIEGGWTLDFSERDAAVATELRNDLPEASDGPGGVLEIAAGGGVTLDGLTISGGSATGNGGGLSVRAAGPIVLEDCRVLDNAAGGEGGGLHLEAASGPVLLSRSLVSGNGAALGGGGSVKGASVSIAESEISGNAAADADGGLRATVASGGSLVVSGCSIAGNQAAAGASGLSVAAAGTAGVSLIDVHDSVVSGNAGAPDFVVAADCAALADDLELSVLNNIIGSYDACPDFRLDASNTAAAP